MVVPARIESTRLASSSDPWRDFPTAAMFWRFTGQDHHVAANSALVNAGVSSCTKVFCEEVPARGVDVVDVKVNRRAIGE